MAHKKVMRCVGPSLIGSQYVVGNFDFTNEIISLTPHGQLVRNGSYLGFAAKEELPKPFIIWGTELDKGSVAKLRIGVSANTEAGASCPQLAYGKYPVKVSPAPVVSTATTSGALCGLLPVLSANNAPSAPRVSRIRNSGYARRRLPTIS